MKNLLFIIVIGILFTADAETRKIDGKLLVTKDRWRFENYTIQLISNKGITIIYSNVFAERRTTIKPQYWPSKLRNQLIKRIYMDSQGKIYDIKLCAKRENQLYKRGDYFFKTGIIVKKDKKTYMNIPPDSFIIRDTKNNKIEYGSYQEQAMLVLDRINKHNYIVKLLYLPSKKQLKTYFSGKLNP
ncbi:MAG: hypothetical protein KOO69_01395 [Victivallales bacterium]|nr:hypothetical protein [Victivallales bacterium]